jgi:hypothetical protein
MPVEAVSSAPHPVRVGMITIANQATTAGYAGMADALRAQHVEAPHGWSQIARRIRSPSARALIHTTFVLLPLVA